MNVRGEVTINCSYPASHENNEKFPCKGENPFNCEELISTKEEERDVVNCSFKIRELKYFYGSVSKVSTADSRTY